MIYTVTEDTFFLFKNSIGGQVFYLEGDIEVKLYLQVGNYTLYATHVREDDVVEEPDDFGIEGFEVQAEPRMHSPYLLWKQEKLSDAVRVLSVRGGL